MSNRLSRETSPYLQQHADNPVDWYPWGEEGLSAARAEDRPILLSIGYSACHWCHVMAHESFEDAEVAALMNRHFVNIKVDREERPDLDQIYQLAQQMITGRSGGWPLTMFLTPGGEPFFGGTYFPKEARYGLPGFPELLLRAAQFYRAERAEISTQAAALRNAFGRLQPAGTGASADFSPEPIEQALKNLWSNFDATHGGFGAAPKFPHPAELELCLRRHATGDALAMALGTLAGMAQGGIYDQLGGGFCRYSVDARWHIPHFEKMLYDNASLLERYSDAWALTRDPLFAEVAEQTAAWIMREMQSPEGGYYSSLDADSEHEEGKFYVWTPEAVQALLSADEYAVCAPYFGLDDPPNFEGTHWHLRRARSVEEVAAAQGESVAACTALLASGRSKLLAAREQRVRPGRDEKILTSWNALMIAGMARAARVFDRADWLASARAALAFLRANLWREDPASGRTRLLATCKDGRAHLNAYLDDYAYLLAALLEILQADYAGAELEFAEQVAQVLLDAFYDPAQGGFFFTSHDHEALIHRPKVGHDGATPSGNGVAARALLRLGHITGGTHYLDAAERTVRLFHPQLTRQPEGHANLLMALEEMIVPPRIAVLRGPRAALAQWQRALAPEYRPTTLVLAVPAEERELAPLLAKPLAGDAVNAWVCQGVSCQPPVDKLDALRAALKAPAAC